MENTFSLNINTAQSLYKTQSCEYSQILINRPFARISPVNLSPFSVQQVRILIIRKQNDIETLMFHLDLIDSEDIVICYKDIHTDFIVSKFKEVTGGYRIKPICTTFEKAKQDYTTNSNYSCESILLNLTIVQKNALVRKIIQDYWFFDKAFSKIYRNSNIVIARAIHQVVSALNPVGITHYIPSSYLTSLKKQRILADHDILKFENIENSTDELDILKVKLFSLEKNLENELLNKCSHLDFPHYLDFSREELIEVIRDEFELCRQNSSRIKRHYTIQSSLDLTGHIKAKIWLDSMIGADESLMNIRSEIESVKNSLGMN